MSKKANATLRPEEIKVDSIDSGIRVDRWFTRHYQNLTHNHLQKLIRKGQVRLNGKRTKPGDRVFEGYTIRVPQNVSNYCNNGSDDRQKIISKSQIELIEQLRARILYQDSYLLAINKPRGLAVQGGRGVSISIDDILWSLSKDSSEKPRLVHRLDKDTSGVLLVAKRPDVAALLTSAFQKRMIRKIYSALVVGVPRPSEGRMEARLEKLYGKNGERVRISDSGKKASTMFRTLESTGKYISFIVLQPETGRTHQLRVHCAEGLGCPILGDGKYGGHKAHPDVEGLEPFLHLHARSIVIPRLSDFGYKKDLYISAPEPEHFQVARSIFGISCNPTDDPFVDVRER